MNLLELLEKSTQWFAWLGLGLTLLTIISFLLKWGVRFRLVGAAVFSLLLAASTLTFTASYKPPLIKEGAKYAPIVFDNGYDLVIAQADEDFPDEAIQPTLEQIAANLKGGGRSRAMVHIRIRRLEPAGNGVATPIVLGEVIRDIENNLTIKLKDINDQNPPPLLNLEGSSTEQDESETLPPLNLEGSSTQQDESETLPLLNLEGSSTQQDESETPYPLNLEDFTSQQDEPEEQVQNQKAGNSKLLRQSIPRSQSQTQNKWSFKSK